MSIFKRIKSFVRRSPDEQIVGYSLSELKSVFTQPLPPPARPLPDCSQVVSLANLDIPAYYCVFLITDADVAGLEALVESDFSFVAEKPFNGLSVKHYSNTRKDEHLIYFKSNSEFNATTIRMVTNSIDFLNSLQGMRLAVPPPWIAFEGYEPSWWGGAMHGAQGYYNDSYFLPFFTRLSRSERQQYYAKFNASDAWIESLELMYAD
ncbi:hypothetical protein [Pseudomonas sp. B21-053]|uniref:hypothetical protein n=1 Tax=Pseudomonas sp. B21-053 TaxID=2895493 RepID=UPI0022325EC9|nr:hypothetical protein [Pseudomonas sp. B21-053]UZE09816.1 hypothetical protein LOY68_20115 [Pseudomonas sp. B21-053]